MVDSVFREYDLRGKYPAQIDEGFAKRLGQATGTFVKGKKFIIGYDVRYSSLSLHDHFLSGLFDTCKEIISIGQVPSPLLSFYCWKEKTDGVMITASHNPIDYNGFKFFNSKGIGYSSEYKLLKEIFNSGKFVKTENHFYKTVNSFLDYSRYVFDNIQIDKKLKVVIDSLNASAALVLPELYNLFNLELIEIRNEPKSNFGFILPNPTEADMSETYKAVLDNKADFAVAYDGDADRAAIIDDKARMLTPSQVGALIVDYFLKDKKGNIILTRDCSTQLKELVQKKHHLIISDIGHPIVGSLIHKEQALFGMEDSGHFFHDNFSFSDGLFTGLKIAQILSQTDKKLSKLVDKYKFNLQLSEYYEVDDKDKILDKVGELLKEKEKTRDGYFIDFGSKGWVWIRKSNTSSKINLIIEAKDQKQLTNLKDKYQQMIYKCLK